MDLQPAIDRLSATQLTDTTWAYYAHEAPHRWYVLTEGDLRLLAEYLEHPDEEIRDRAYSLWCSTGAGTEMPADWTPESRAPGH